MSDPLAHYRGEAGRRYHAVKRGVPAQALSWVARLRAEKLRFLVGPTDTVFEYGCGAGWNLAAVPAARRLGFDVAEFLRAEVERHGIEFVADTAPLPSGLADVVICHHALEHLSEPLAALAEMRRLLKSGGRLGVWVPFERERRYRRFDPAEPNHHLFSWTVQSLGNLVTAAGFTVRQAGLARYGYDRFAAVWAVRLGLGEAGFRALRRMLITVRPLWEVTLTAGLATHG
jgi:SAM-dependent methyltransferase